MIKAWNLTDRAASIHSSLRRMESVVLCCGIIGVLSSMCMAEDGSTQLTAQIAEPTPIQDDATLYDVAIVGDSNIWAVGEHGAVWRSRDAGANWEFLSLSPLLERYAFHSVCFLTDRVGWIAGGTVLSVGGTTAGIILSTKDGGATWSVENSQNLPYLKYVRFFDLENGIVSGARSTTFPTGVLVTTDGGQFWTPMTAQKSGHWNAAAFTSPDSGILAGEQGVQAVVARGSILNSGPGARGLRAFHGASLDAGGRAWLAGDGSYLFRSDNHGVSWTPIHPQLPTELEDFSNFRSVAHYGDQAWVAGSPGSVIWHTTDGGNTWDQQRTGDSIPLEVIRFANPFLGVAAGRLGRICVTKDGGKTWQAVRGANRRLACLAVQTHVERTAVPFLTRWSREEGYRSAVMIATRRDTGEDAHVTRQLDLRLAHAVQTAGGNRGWIDWRLPLALPSIEKDRKRLIEEWTLLTDRRLTEVLLGNLVAEIRLWRPSVLLIDEPVAGEFASELIQRAVTKAMQQASDPAFGFDQQQLADLAPWTVKKLVMKRPVGTSGTISLDPLEILPHAGTTLDLAAADALGQLNVKGNSIVPRIEYVVIRAAGDPPLSDRNIFSDLGIAPGSAARRSQETITSLDYDKLIAEANHRRSINAISARITSSPSHAGQLLGQMKKIIGPLSPEQAAQQLATLGKMYHDNGEWTLAESVYAELITRYPEQPAAVDAMLWLVKFWTSAEMNWQRLRAVQATGATVQVDGGLSEEAAEAQLEAAIQTFRDQKTKTAAALKTPSLSFPGTVESNPIVPTSGNLQSVVNADGSGASQYQMFLTRWQTAAVAVIGGVRDVYPQLFEQPEMQFVTAALARRRNSHKQADEIYSTFMKTLSDDPWNIAARGEAYLLRPGVQSPKPVIVCKATKIPPVLDGVLSDPCWAEAFEVRLGDKSVEETFIGAKSLSVGATSRVGAQPVIFLAHDDRYLYLAASVPIHAQLPMDPPELAGRTHDADLDLFDHLSIQLDVDRDYGTYYRFDIDQRGQTREACWDNWAYNPKWYCAAVRDADAWRVECAIPLEELLPPERIVGTTWGLGITRILPGLGSQSWTDSGANIPHPPLFGLLRFE